MHKAKNIAENLIKELASKHEKNLPFIDWQVFEQKGEEGFHLSAYDNAIKFRANGYADLINGLSQFGMAFEGGFLSNLLGQNKPKCFLRPAWPQATRYVPITSEMSLAIPAWALDPQSLQEQSQRLLELGLNAIILGFRDGLVHLQEVRDGNLKSICSLFQECGLRVIIRPEFSVPETIKKCPLDPKYREWLGKQTAHLLKFFPCFDIFFWESRFKHRDFFSHPKARDATQLELILAEARIFEEHLVDMPLIHYIPSADDARQQAVWMTQLCDLLGSHTILSFPAVAGHYYDNYKPPHPFWTLLHEREGHSQTPLLPIFNVGYVASGEGLWPAVCLETLERYNGYLNLPTLAGFVSLLNQVPKRGSLLDANCWVAAQVQWGKFSPELLAHIWFKVYFPDWEVNHTIASLREGHRVIQDLGILGAKTQENMRDSLSADEGRILTDTLLSRVKLLQLQNEKLASKRGKKDSICLTDFYAPFVQDAKNIVFHFLQVHNLSIPHTMNHEKGMGFWTDHTRNPSQEVRVSGNIQFLDKPLRGNTGSRMEAIYTLSRVD